MEHIVQTLNKGEIKMGYVDESTQNVQIGDLILPTRDFIGLMHMSIINKKQEISLNGYKIPSVALGYQVDKLIHEGSHRETEEQKYL